MSTLLYTHTARAATPSDEANVRSTVTVVQPDAPASVMAHSPDFNEVVLDNKVARLEVERTFL